MSKCQKFRQLFHFSNPTLLNCAINVCSSRFEVSLCKSLNVFDIGESELGPTNHEHIVFVHPFLSPGELFIVRQSGLNVLLEVARFVC